jgi:hypothetical protein
MPLEGRAPHATYTASRTADDGSAGTPRWAIRQANANRHADTIVFSSLFNAPETINLTGRQLTLSDPARITITGPGANLLTINGNNASRVFRITPGSSASISGLTITGGSAKGNGGGVENSGGTLALSNVILRGNQARVGGGLFNNGNTTLSNVLLSNNHARMGTGIFSARNAVLARLGLSSPAATGPILSQTFNVNGKVPTGWTQFLPGDVVESSKTFLTITDSSGNSAGIAANPTKTVPFNPVGVVTKMTAVISSISAAPLGNAIIGLLGQNGSALAGELAAGIDAAGNVFIVVYDPASKISQQTIVPVGVLKGYTGGMVTMTMSINATGVQITAGSTQFRVFSFSKDLDNFSLKTAFPSGAVPALVAASQEPTKPGGAASFESIGVSTNTALGRRR